jgi:hypothetical protein
MALMSAAVLGGWLRALACTAPPQLKARASAAAAPELREKALPALRKMELMRPTSASLASRACSCAAQARLRTAWPLHRACRRSAACRQALLASLELRSC